MHISYNKLWKLLIAKDMTKMDLKDAAGISAASIAKLGKGANITTDVLLKICETLNVHIEDILETRDDGIGTKQYEEILRRDMIYSVGAGS